MITRPFRLCGVGVTSVLLTLAVTAPASSQTPFPGGFEIRLLPGFTHQPLKPEHGPNGLLKKKDGLEILYVMGRHPQGKVPTSGDYRSSASASPKRIASG